MYKDLSLKEKSELFKLMVSNGITDINEIERIYNSYQEGGNKVSVDNLPESEQYAVTTPDGQRKVFNSKQEAQQYITANTPKGYSVYDITNYSSNIDKSQTDILNRNTKREIYQKNIDDYINTEYSANNFAKSFILPSLAAGVLGYGVANALAIPEIQGAANLYFAKEGFENLTSEKGLKQTYNYIKNATQSFNKGNTEDSKYWTAKSTMSGLGDILDTSFTIFPIYQAYKNFHLTYPLLDNLGVFVQKPNTYTRGIGRGTEGLEDLITSGVVRGNPRGSEVSAATFAKYWRHNRNHFRDVILDTKIKNIENKFFSRTLSEEEFNAIKESSKKYTIKKLNKDLSYSESYADPLSKYATYEDYIKTINNDINAVEKMPSRIKSGEVKVNTDIDGNPTDRPIDERFGPNSDYTADGYPISYWYDDGRNAITSGHDYAGSNYMVRVLNPEQYVPFMHQKHLHTSLQYTPRLTDSNVEIFKKGPLGIVIKMDKNRLLNKKQYGGKLNKFDEGGNKQTTTLETPAFFEGDTWKPWYWGTPEYNTPTLKEAIFNAYVDGLFDQDIMWNNKAYKARLTPQEATEWINSRNISFENKKTKPNSVSNPRERMLNTYTPILHDNNMYYYDTYSRNFYKDNKGTDIIEDPNNDLLYAYYNQYVSPLGKSNNYEDMVKFYIQQMRNTQAQRRKFIIDRDLSKDFMKDAVTITTGKSGTSRLGYSKELIRNIYENLPEYNPNDVLPMDIYTALAIPYVESDFGHRVNSHSDWMGTRGNLIPIFNNDGYELPDDTFYGDLSYGIHTYFNKHAKYNKKTDRKELEGLSRVEFLNKYLTHREDDLFDIELLYNKDMLNHVGESLKKNMGYNKFKKNVLKDKENPNFYKVAFDKARIGKYNPGKEEVYNNEVLKTAAALRKDPELNKTLKEMGIIK